MIIKMIELDAAAGEDFHFKNAEARNGHLFVRFKSDAMVLTKKGMECAKSGNFIFYNKEETVEYSSLNGKFSHDYFRFEMEDDENMFDLPTSTLFNYPLAGKAEEILRILAIEYYSVSKSRNLTLDLLGKAFLLSAGECIEKYNSSNNENVRYFELVKLRTEILSAPQQNYKIKEIADKVYMSPSYFQNIYKKTFGTSCINDIINARIKKAIYLLTSTNKTEAEIAELCGYNSVEHFIRQFKKIKGISPSKYKKNNTTV